MAGMALSLSSCGDDFLSVDPASSLPIDGYYNTKAHVDEALTAAYAPMAWYDLYNGMCPLFLVSDAQGDDIYVGGGNTNDQTEIHLASQYKSTSLLNFKGAWTTSYSGINRSNLVIKDVDEATVLSDAEKATYIAEAKTLKAFIICSFGSSGAMCLITRRIWSPLILPSSFQPARYIIR